MANRHKSQAAGKSGAEALSYSGGSSVTAKAAKKKSDGFQCGGRTGSDNDADDRKRGGKVMGKKSKGRMDKFARGGRTGGSPYSSAHVKTNGDACG
jgi:hypothetical protein